ncbi:TPA: hypothetical protein ACP4W6_000001, partial [Klebsiella quasipneumoniae]
KQKAQSEDWAFLRLCHPARVPACLPGSPARGAQHRLRRKSHHISLIIFIQSNIKPRRGNPFAIIHFFLAPALALIAKTVLTKKNVNAITYKDITII